MAKKGINEHLRGVLNCLADRYEKSDVWKRKDLPNACGMSCPIYGTCLKLWRVINEEKSVFEELAK